MTDQAYTIPEKEEDMPQDMSEANKLTSWKQEPSVMQLKQDLQDAASDRQTHISKVDAWLDNLHVTGAAKPKKRKGRSAVQPKLIRKQAEWRYAALSEPFLSTEDVFNVAPVTGLDKEAARQNQLVLNNQFNTKFNKISFIDEYVRTAVDEGTVVIKYGWEFEEEQQTVEEPNIVNVPVNDPALAQTMLAMGQEPVAQAQVGTKKVEKMVTIVNKPTVQVCNYKNLTIDPTCEGDLSKANFIIHSWESSLSELKKDARYKNLEKIQVNQNSPLSMPDSDHETKDESNFNFRDKPRTKFVVYEYWGYRDVDGSGSLTPIVATWVGDVMIRMEELPFPDGKLPFIAVQYLPVRKSVYGEPDGELLEDNQKIVGAVTRGMIDIMGRSANGQQASRKDALDLTNRRRFEAGQDYEFNANVDPRQAFHMHTYPEIPQSALTIVELQNNEAESLTGVKAFTQGISGQALGSTATGIRSALDATSKRELGILRRLAAGIIELGYRMIAMNSEWLEDVEVIRITDEEFVDVKRDDLGGRFDLKLSISTAEADNEKAQDLSFMLQTLGNNMDFSFTQIILAEIADLKKMPALATKIREFEPKPNPLEQERQMLEIELLKAQIFNERAKGVENQTDVNLKKAKTQTELAKGRNLESKSDQQDLDYLEQESGLKRQHEHDLKDHDKANTLDEKAADTLLGQQQNGEGSGFNPLPAL